MEERMKEMTRVWTRAARDEAAKADERVALQLALGIDLDMALAMRGACREKLHGRLRRLAVRERLKAGRPGGGYDLDRHIALKRALDRLTGRTPDRGGSGALRPSGRSGRRLHGTTESRSA